MFYRASFSASWGDELSLNLLGFYDINPPHLLAWAPPLPPLQPAPGGQGVCATTDRMYSVYTRAVLSCTGIWKAGICSRAVL